MSYAEDLKLLLAPLGVYDLEAPFNGGELAAQGGALDGAAAALEELLRESCPLTAESWGLEQLAGLFARRPAAATPQAMGEALAALLRIGGDSFTLAAIQDTLTGCGLRCQVAETDQTGTVAVSFPNVAGIPQGFGEMRAIIEDILPAHLLAQYVFWYLTWAELEAKLPTWQALETLGLSWAELETYVN